MQKELESYGKEGGKAFNKMEGGLLTVGEYFRLKEREDQDRRLKYLRENIPEKITQLKRESGLNKGELAELVYDDWGIKMPSARAYLSEMMRYYSGVNWGNNVRLSRLATLLDLFEVNEEDKLIEELKKMYGEKFLYPL